MAILSMGLMAFSPACQKPVNESSEKRLKLSWTERESDPAKSTRYSRKMAGRKPVLSPQQIAPLCACGCGQHVKAHRGTWNNRVTGHGMRGKKQSALNKKVNSQRMALDNPMKRPEVVAKMTATYLSRYEGGKYAKRSSRKGIPLKRSPEGLARIVAASRKRMLSDKNPMKNQATHKAAMAKILSRTTSKNELHFKAWYESRNLPIQHKGDGSFWIGRRNPDFRVIGQRKVIEVTQKECFPGRRKIRTADEYGMETIKYYRSKGWECLVVFKKDHRCTIPDSLLPIIQNFIYPIASWSGVWNYDLLIPFGEYPSES